MFEKDTWQFINTFAPWLSAIGTLAAVGVSLYLARQDKRVRIDVTAGHRHIVTQGQRGKPPEYMAIRIVNVGHREAQITGIGWKIGLLKKQHAEQITINDGISSPLPVKLRDGEEAKYYFPLGSEHRWLKDFLENFIKYHSKSRLKFLKVRVFTSVGKTFEATIEKGLRNKLLEYMEQRGHYQLGKNS